MPSTDYMQETLNARGSVHGPFEQQARVCEELTRVMERTPNWASLTPAEQNSIKMIFCKMSRIGWGEPHYPDHWIDIQGYAQLGVRAMHNYHEAPKTEGIMPARDYPDRDVSIKHANATPAGQSRY